MPRSGESLFCEVIGDMNHFPASPSVDSLTLALRRAVVCREWPHPARGGGGVMGLGEVAIMFQNLAGVVGVATGISRGARGGLAVPGGLWAGGGR